MGVGAGSEDGVGVAAAGAGSSNTIKNHVEAYAQNGATLTSTFGDLSLLATDTSTIVANAGGVGIAVAFGSENGVGVSLGIAASINDVENSVLAYAQNATLMATDGNITLAARETASVQGAHNRRARFPSAWAVAVQASESTPRGRARETRSRTPSRPTPTLARSLTTVTLGDITLSADDTPVIVANAGGVGIGVGVSGGGVGAGASLGVAAAVNDVEDNVYAYIAGASATAAGSLALSTNTGGGINFTSAPGLNTGDAVVFQVGATGNVAPGGLKDGTTYYAVKINDTEIALATTLANALAGTTIPLTSSGSGTGMSLDPGRQ